MMHLTLLAFALAAADLVSAHGWIQQFGGQRAQKTDLKSSAFRAAPDNTGWIGSNFMSSQCTVCGCSSTPGGTVAAPGGTNFAQAGQAAGRQLSVAAGKSVELLVSGNPGDGWPHPTGHLQVYLADCGGSCTNFDAAQGNYFKIQSLKDGVPALRAAMDRGRDGNPWNVPIPSGVKSGNYILKAEIWAYGQSSPAEGQQVQYYPFCGQIEVTGGGNANPATVKFPDVYANDKDIAGQGISYVPGPQINAAFGGSGTGTGSSSAPVQKNESLGSSSGSSGSSSSGSSGSSSNSGSSSSTKGNSSGKKCSKNGKRMVHRRHHARNAASIHKV